MLSQSDAHFIASLNVQSLNAKHATLSDYINHTLSHNHHIKVLALQETCSIKHPNSLHIPLYHLAYINRPVGRGRGVGFYIRDDVNFTKIEDLSVFVPKVFESLSIELTIDNKKLAVTMVYRPPSPPYPMSITAHINEFSHHLDILLTNLSDRYHTSYICLDSTSINSPPTQITHLTNTFNQLHQMDMFSASLMLPG
jgi:exonuclease III